MFMQAVRYTFAIVLIIMAIIPVPPTTIVALAIVQIPAVRRFLPGWVTLAMEFVCPIRRGKQIIQYMREIKGV